MPDRPSKNVVQKIVEFPPEQAEAVMEFARARGETFRAVVLHALRRHLAFPPPPPEPQLPPPPEPLLDATNGKKPRRKKNSEKPAN